MKRQNAADYGCSHGGTWRYACRGRKGAMLGVVLGPVGAVIGGFVGGTLGYMAGSKTGETVVKTMQKVRDKVCDAVGELWETGKEFVGNAVETVRDKISEIGDFLFGWL